VIRNLLALDVASQTGWAYGPPNQIPTFGTVDFNAEGKDYSARMGCATSWISRFLKAHPVDQIGMEDSFFRPTKPGQSGDKLNTVQLLMGYQGAISGAAYVVGGHKLLRYKPSEIDVSFLGKRSTGGRNARKKAIWDVCRWEKYPVKTQDEADAGALHKHMSVYWSAAV